jgi:hypothetical protein
MEEKSANPTEPLGFALMRLEEPTVAQFANRYWAKGTASNTQSGQRNTRIMTGISNINRQK